MVPKMPFKLFLLNSSPSPKDYELTLFSHNHNDSDNDNDNDLTKIFKTRVVYFHQGLNKDIKRKFPPSKSKSLSQNKSASLHTMKNA
jgi:hypothetical protein